LNTRDDSGRERPIRNRESISAASSGIDELADEIFARLNHGDGSASVEDVQLHLERAASALVKHLDASSQAAMQATLQSLTSNQRSALLWHQDGLTCGQIAQRQGRTSAEVLKDLTTAYVQLRFSLASFSL